MERAGGDEGGFCDMANIKQEELPGGGILTGGGRALYLYVYVQTGVGEAILCCGIFLPPCLVSHKTCMTTPVPPLILHSLYFGVQVAVNTMHSYHVKTHVGVLVNF